MHVGGHNYLKLTCDHHLLRTLAFCVQKILQGLEGVIIKSRPFAKTAKKTSQ